MKMWAILHKPSGGYLPGFGSRKGRGGFTNDDPSTVEPPRLFRERHHAKSALDHWLKGKLRVWQEQGHDGEWDERWDYDADPNRCADDMDIVQLDVGPADVHVIRLTPAEIQSKHDRVKWAEGLIRQLPEDHDGRNSWLLNYGSEK